MNVNLNNQSPNSKTLGDIINSSFRDIFHNFIKVILESIQNLQKHVGLINPDVNEFPKYDTQYIKLFSFILRNKNYQTVHNS